MTGLFTYGPGRNPAPTGLGIPNTVNFYTFPTPLQINAIRAAKRVYVADASRMLTEDGLRRYFNETLTKKGWKVDLPGEPVKEVVVDMEDKFAMIEFRHPDEASSALALDGEEVDGHTLKLKQPKEMIGIDPALGDGSSFGETRKESPNKLFIGGLPPNLNEDQVMELLKSFGDIKTFQLIKDGELSRVSLLASSTRAETGAQLMYRALHSASTPIAKPPKWPLPVSITLNSVTEPSPSLAPIHLARATLSPVWVWSPSPSSPKAPPLAEPLLPLAASCSSSTWSPRANCEMTRNTPRFSKM